MTNEQTSVPDELEDLFKVNSVEYIRNSDKKNYEVIDSNIKELRKVPNEASKKDACSYLLKILENVLLDPKNLKTRRIPKSNKVFLKYISHNEVFVNFFNSFGFVTVKEFYVLQVVEFHKLLYAYKELICVLRDCFNVTHPSLESHFFDPFKSYKHNTNVYANSDTFEITAKDETKSLIEDTVKDISERCQSPSTLDDWNPVIKVDVTPIRGNKIQPKKADDYNPPPSTLIKMYNIGKNENFESRSKKELENLRAKSELAKKSPVVEIKVKFPKSTTLTIQVPVKTLVGRVRQNIQSILVDGVPFDDWYLVEFPIRRRIDDSKTLLEEEIVLKSILHFTFTDVEKNRINVIKEEFLEKYKTQK